MKRNGVSWLAIIMVAVSILLVTLAVGARSAVGRAFDMATYKAADPYYQSLALRDQVVDGGHGDSLLWIVGGILALVLLGWLLGRAAPFIKETRLAYVAVRPRQVRGRRTAPRSSLPIVSSAPTLRVQPGGNPLETINYDTADVGDRSELSSGYER